METELAKKLQQVLDGMSKEEVAKSWNSILGLELEGPNLDDALSYIDYNQIEKTHSNFDFSNLGFDTYQSFDINYNLAA